MLAKSFDRERYPLLVGHRRAVVVARDRHASRLLMSRAAGEAEGEDERYIFWMLSCVHLPSSAR